ncbi:ankyrin repeat domain-containing protein 10-like [Boleophthalmus pectinirostris]|uniref:ankyrin repeat domain-containing protein 10-like n=1 Tax=Boleophthalmus pectinirostris TaxID=150288 RepID=UPI00242C65F9|nr:ankyrin repeat domain-containing protein 10-like [Boleophthalmus pectinirostris]
MSSGAEMELCSEEAFTQRFPLHRACRDGDVAGLLALLRRLSEHANPAGHLSTEDCRYGWTPLHWAAHYGQLECVILLVQMGCEVNTASSRFDQTPTHTAAFGGHSHCVVWLTQAGADVNRQDLTGEAPIHKAARTGSLECIEVLLIAGAKPHVRNACGQTAADLAQAQGFLDCFHLISSLLQLHGTPCALGQGSRKRMLHGHEHSQEKRARVDDEQQHQTGAEDSNMDCALLSDETTVFTPNRHADSHIKLPSSDSTSAQDGAERCGSLHLSCSPESWGSERVGHWGLGCGEGAELLYGHYHGYGDTAEELTVYTQPDHVAMTT